MHCAELVLAAFHQRPHEQLLLLRSHTVVALALEPFVEDRVQLGLRCFRRRVIPQVRHLPVVVFQIEHFNKVNRVEVYSALLCLISCRRRTHPFKLRCNTAVLLVCRGSRLRHNTPV